MAPQSAAPNSGHIVSRLLPILGVIVIGWFALRFFNENHTTVRQATQAVAAAVRAPITLQDEVQNVRAASWQAIPLNLPYNGEIDVDLSVVQGNPLNVFVISADQLDMIKNNQWSQLRVFQDFNATKTKTYRRKAPLNQGNYYLVLRDTSLGLLSQRASDVAIKVTLNP